MSGTETLVEILVKLPRSARARWRRTRAARALTVLAAVPAAEGRLELVEDDTTIEARAFFSEEAEARAELLIDAFRASASHGAEGTGTMFLLVDYQREEGRTLTVGGGTSSLVPMTARKARARHPSLDAFFERCVTPVAAPAAAPSNAPVDAAAARSLEVVRTHPAEVVLEAWTRIVATSMTSAAFCRSKADVKRLHAVLAGTPEPRWPWARVLPIRLHAQLAPGSLDDLALELLQGEGLAAEERWMLLEVLVPSSSDRALDALATALDGEELLANAALRGLAFAAHPRTTDVLLVRAQKWRESAAATPRELPHGTTREMHQVCGSLQLRNDGCCRAMLRTIWERFHALRDVTPRGSEATGILAARTYLEACLVGVEPGVAAAVRSAYPGPRASLDGWAGAVEALDRAVPATTRG